MNNMIIDNSSSGIVVTETKITISDEKLNGMLLKTYEAATIEGNKFKIHSLWGVCWSVAGTLLMAILTSTFNAIGSVEASTVRNWAIGICIISFIVGLVFIIWRVNDKTANDIAKRDEAVQEIVNTYLKK